MENFEEKTAVITGAASGIGYALAEPCAREGMNVVMADVEEGALSGAEKNIKGLQSPVLALKPMSLICSFRS